MEIKMKRLLRISPKSIIALVSAIFITTAHGAYAQDAMLTLISGERVISLSEADLLALPQADLQTENEFLEGMVTYTGPLARDVIALLEDETATIAILTAVNDYAVEVPLEDFLDYDTVFAHSTDGDRLSLRDRGPLWLIYPMSDHAELRDRVYNNRSIWQLAKVELK